MAVNKLQIILSFYTYDITSTLAKLSNHSSAVLRTI